VEPQEGKERSSAHSLGGQRAAMRMVKDETDGVVLVYELEPSKTNPEPPALVFESRRECSRLLQYPAEWRRLTPEQLLALRPGH
jgi:hypothetical protein